MKKSLIAKTVLSLLVLGLVACGGDNNKKHNSNASSSMGSSVSSSSSSAAAVSNVMEKNKEYVYSANTKITNTGTTDLVVTKKHYWDSNKTVVILQEGNATID